ncbi:hypothetical protein ACVII0_003084 [Sinorhizobium meliloti]
MFYDAARAPDGGRDHIVRIGHGRSAEDDDQVVRIGSVRDRGGDRFGGMSHALLAIEAAARLQEPCGEDGARLVHNLALQRRQLSRHQGRAPRRERLDLEGPIRPKQCLRSLHERLRHGKRDDLDRRHHVAGVDGNMIGKAGERDRRIYTVQPIDDGAIGNEKAGSGSIDVDPAGRGPREPQVIRSDRRSYARRGFVLRQVVRLEPRDNDLRDIRFGKRRDIVGAQAMPL